MQQTAYSRIAEKHAKKRLFSKQREPKTIITYFKDFMRSLLTFFFAQIGVCGLLVAYNVGGAFAFRTIEGVYGDYSVSEKAETSLRSTVHLLWNVTVDLNVFEEVRWRQTVEKAVLDYQSSLVPLIRYKGYRGMNPNETWTIPASLMYCLSIYTTIGYGNLTPRTDGGKVVTILYALIGMPLMLLYMSNVGEVLARIFKFLYFTACRCDMASLGYYRTESGSLRPVQSLSQLEAIRLKNAKEKEKFELSSGSPQKIPHIETFQSISGSNKETIPITWCLLVICLFVIFGGGLFSMWEGWTVLDACYFCYTSLSTIGLGDIVPGGTTGYTDNTSVQTQQILATVYLLIGMALVAMCFNLMQEEALENLKAFWRSIGCLREKITRKTDRNNLPSQYDRKYSVHLWRKHNVSDSMKDEREMVDISSVTSGHKSERFRDDLEGD